MKQKLPSMYGAAEYVDVGGLMSMRRRIRHVQAAAIYVDRILKGANPATMAIEQPATFELVINAPPPVPSARRADPLLARANRIVA